jgi:hypothetical protein
MAALSTVHCGAIAFLAARWQHRRAPDLDGRRLHAARPWPVPRMDGMGQGIAGFVGGTGGPICRPDAVREVMDGGHHRRHEAHCQVAVSPGGHARAVHGLEPGPVAQRAQPPCCAVRCRGRA